MQRGSALLRQINGTAEHSGSYSGGGPREADLEPCRPYPTLPGPDLQGALTAGVGGRAREERPYVYAVARRPGL